MVVIPCRRGSSSLLGATISMPLPKLLYADRRPRSLHAPTAIDMLVGRGKADAGRVVVTRGDADDGSAAAASPRATHSR